MGPTTPPVSLLELRIGVREAGMWWIALAGELDAMTAPALLGVAEAVPPALAVDLETANLAFCDSAGMRAILELAAARDVRPVILRDPCLTLRRLLGLVDTTGLIEIATA